MSTGVRFVVVLYLMQALVGFAIGFAFPILRFYGVI
jgi:hypothetical protein